MHNTKLVSISPDNKYVCMLSRTEPDRHSKKFTFIVYLLSLERDGSIHEVRTYTLSDVPEIGQICFTPDSKAMVYTTLQGSKFVKLDLQSGEQTTIMEHVKGQAGFVSYPPVLTVSDGKLLALGYYYDKNDLGTRDSIVEILPDKTGLEAFTDARLIDHVKKALSPPDCEITYNFPGLDVGFVSVIRDSKHCEMFSWDGERDVRRFEVVKALHSYWCGGSRQAYSVENGDESHKLGIFDAKTDQFITVADDLADPYWYVFLSGDGKTVMFSEGKTGGSLYSIRYAREDEGWKVTPIKGLEKPLLMGKERISLDGKKMCLFNDTGLYVADLEAAK